MAALLGLAALVRPATLLTQPPTYVGGTGPESPTLTVLRTAPGDSAAPRAIVTVTFDRPVADALVGRAPPPGLLTITPAVPGRLRWRDPITLAFVPDGAFESGRQYAATVAAGITAVDGTRLARPHAFTFRVPGGRLLAAHASGPYPNANQLPPSPVVQLVYAPAAPPDSLARLARLELAPSCPGGAARVALRATGRRPLRRDDPWELQRARWPSAPGRDSLQVVELVPVRPLPLDCRFAVVAPAALDEPARETRTEYRTHPAFRLLGARCLDGDRCWGSPIILDFSTPVRGSDLQRHLRAASGMALTVGGDTSRVQTGWAVGGAFVPRSQYAFEVDGALRDLFGQTLGATATAALATSAVPASLAIEQGARYVARGDTTIHVRHVNVDTILVTALAVAPELERRIWALGAASVGRGLDEVWRELAAAGGADPITYTVPLAGADDEARVTPVPLPASIHGDGTRMTLVFVRLHTPRAGSTAEQWIPPNAHDPPSGLDFWRMLLLQRTDLAVHARVGRAGGAVWVTDARTLRPRAGARVQLVDSAGRMRAEARTDAEGIAELALDAEAEAAAVQRRLPPPGDDPGLQYLDHDPAFAEPLGVLRVTTDDDRALAVPGGTSDVWFGHGDGDGVSTDPTLARAGMLATDRGLYRPGDRVFASAVVRRGPLHALAPPATGDSVRWVTRRTTPGDWRQVVVRDTVTTVSRFGTAVDSARLPRAAELGDHQLTLYAVSGGRWRPVRRTTYRVAEYRAPEFLADASADTTATRFAGDTLDVVVRARYLYGAPMPGAVVRWSATATPLAGWAVSLPLPAGFAVGSMAWRHWLDEGAGGPEPLGDGQDTLGADGTRRLAVPTVRPTDASPVVVGPGGAARAGGGPVRVRVEAVVADLNRQAVATAVTATVHPASVYVAARVAPPADDTTAARLARTPGATTASVVDSVERVEVLVVTPEGERRTDVPVTMTVHRHAPPAGAPYGPPAMDTVARCSLVSGAEPAVCVWTPRRAGMHEIVLSARDPQGRPTRTTVMRYVVDPAAARDWTGQPTASIALDRADLAPGDTARLTLRSPFRDAEAWLTVEREGVLEQRRLRVREHEASAVLPIDERFAPNVVVHALVVAHAGAALPDADPVAMHYPHEDVGAVRTALLPLRVSPEGRRLRVVAVPTSAEVAPGDTARLRVHVHDTAGAGVRAEVTVWAVDEGVLALTGHAPPDPIAALYRPRGTALGLASSERARLDDEPPPLTTHGGRLVLHDQLRLTEVTVTGRADAEHMPAPAPAPPPPPAPSAVEETDFAGRGVAGGRAVAAAPPPVRADFRSTAFYAGRALTDADGVASVAARLPDDLTTYRLVALAVAADARAGADTAGLVATRPLVARPALPRFVRPGDRLDAGVVVAVREAAADTARVQASASRALVLDDTATRTVAVSDARGAEARFPFHVPTTAEAGDSAVARFVAIGVVGSDAVEVRLPVAPAVHPRAHTVAGMVRGEAAIVFTLPAGTDAARSRLTLDAGTSVLAAVRGAARQLRPNRHDFAERLASAALAWASLAHADAGAAAREARAEVGRAIEPLLARQRPDGGFGIFVHDRQASVWLSAYVGLALLEARAVDVAVDAAALDRLQRFLQASLSDPQPRDREPGWPLADSVRQTRSWLAHRLAAADFLRRAGVPAPAAEDSLLAWAPVMAWEDRLRLAELLAPRADRRDAARRLLDDAWRSARAAGRRVVVADSVLHDTPWAFPSHLRPVARLLTATLALDPDAPLVGALVETVLRQEQAERGRVWNSQDFGAVLPALARVDRRRAAGGGALRLVADGRTVARITPGADSAARTTSLAGLLGADGTVRLQLVAEGGAPAYFWATVHEVPAVPPVSPDTSGLVVERWTERLDGTPVTQVEPGALVRVRLRVTVPEDRQFVVLEDPLPAGLEVVDLRLATSGTLSPFLAAEEPDVAGDTDRATGRDARAARQGMLYGRWEDGWWSPWEHRELRDDRVVYATRLLWRGHYDVSYVARATTSGSFVRPPARAAELYDASLQGRSGGGRLTVRP